MDAGCGAPPPFNRLETPRLVIRRFVEADVPTLVAYRTDPEVARYQSWAPATPESARALVVKWAGSEPGTPGGWFQFALELKATGAHIGDLALHVRADDARQAEIGYTLAHAAWGRGLATEAVGALLDYAFGPLGLHRVTATLDIANARSAALLARLGFRREAHYRRNYWDGRAWTDEYLYALLHDEWPGTVTGLTAPPAEG